MKYLQKTYYGDRKDDGQANPFYGGIIHTHAPFVSVAFVIG